MNAEVCPHLARTVLETQTSQNATEFFLTPPPMTRAVRGTTRFLWSLAGAAQRKTPRLAKPPPAARSALDMASVRNNPRFETRRRLKRPKCYNSLIYGHVMASIYTLVCFISKNKFCCLYLFVQESAVKMFQPQVIKFAWIAADKFGLKGLTSLYICGCGSSLPVSVGISSRK